MGIGINSVTVIITKGCPASCCERAVRRAHSLNSGLSFRLNTICAPSGIFSSISGWDSTYLLNSAERVRCNSQNKSLFIFFYPLQKILTIYLPILAQIIITIKKSIVKVKRWYRQFFFLSFPGQNITMSKFVRSIISDDRIPFAFYKNLKLYYKTKNFIFAPTMKMPFSAIRSIKGKKILRFYFHKKIISRIRGSVNKTEFRKIVTAPILSKRNYKIMDGVSKYSFRKTICLLTSVFLFYKYSGRCSNFWYFSTNYFFCFTRYLFYPISIGDTAFLLFLPHFSSHFVEPC